MRERERERGGGERIDKDPDKMITIHNDNDLMNE